MPTSIQYTIQGSGSKKILLLHGWLSDYNVFNPILKYFDAKKYTVISPDYRGYGRSKFLKGNYTLDEISKDILDLLDGIGWTECIVVGHSMGGQVIQKMALKRKNLIKTAIAIAPVPASGFAMDNDTKKFFESSAEDDKALSQIFNILTGERHASAFLSEMTRDARKATTKEAYLGYLKAWTESDFSQEVFDIKTPIIVIAGAHDGALGAQVIKGTYLKQLTNISLKVINAAGHYPMQETPVELFNIIEESIK